MIDLEEVVLNLLWRASWMQGRACQADKDIIALPVVGNKVQLPLNLAAWLSMNWGLQQTPQLKPTEQSHTLKCSSVMTELAVCLTVAGHCPAVRRAIVMHGVITTALLGANGQLHLARRLDVKSKPL